MNNIAVVQRDRETSVNHIAVVERERESEREKQV